MLFGVQRPVEHRAI